MSTGMVIWFDQQKGYGFIRKADGKDVFMHTRLVPSCRKIRRGDRVQFETSREHQGQLAVRVKKVLTELRRVRESCG
jgi:CspA family cold shock protein